MNRDDLPTPNATCEVCGRKYRRCKKCIELRNRGMETWRLHCDSMECYQILTLVNTEDISTIDKETFDRVASFELPEDRKPIQTVQDKLDAIAKQFVPIKKVEQVQSNSKQEVSTKSSKPRNRVIEYIASKNVK